MRFESKSVGAVEAQLFTEYAYYKNSGTAVRGSKRGFSKVAERYPTGEMHKSAEGLAADAHVRS